MLTEEVRKDRRLKKNQRIQYHLDKLREREIITITLGWEDVRSGKSKIDYKKKTIQLSATGQHDAEYPDLIGDIM